MSELTKLYEEITKKYGLDEDSLICGFKESRDGPKYCIFRHGDGYLIASSLEDVHLLDTKDAEDVIHYIAGGRVQIDNCLQNIAPECLRKQITRFIAEDAAQRLIKERYGISADVKSDLFLLNKILESHINLHDDRQEISKLLKEKGIETPNGDWDFTDLVIKHTSDILLERGEFRERLTVKKVK